MWFVSLLGTSNIFIWLSYVRKLLKLLIWFWSNRKFLFNLHHILKTMQLVEQFTGKKYIAMSVWMGNEWKPFVKSKQYTNFVTTVVRNLQIVRKPWRHFWMTIDIVWKDCSKMKLPKIKLPKMKLPKMKLPKTSPRICSTFL